MAFLPEFSRRLVINPVGRTREIFSASLVLFSIVISSCAGSGDKAFSSLENLVESFEENITSCPNIYPHPDEDPPYAYCVDDSGNGIATLTFAEDRVGLSLELLTSLASNRVALWSGHLPVDQLSFAFGERWAVRSDDETQKMVSEQWGGSVVDSSDYGMLDELYSEVSRKFEKGGLAEVVRGCLFEDGSVSSDGLSASFSTGAPQQFGTWAEEDLRQILCVLFSLRAPDFVFDLITTTRAVDLRQSETWGAFRASWTFSEIEGLDLLVMYTG